MVQTALGCFSVLNSINTKSLQSLIEDAIGWALLGPSSVSLSILRIAVFPEHTTQSHPCAPFCSCRPLTRALPSILLQGFGKSSFLLDPAHRGFYCHASSGLYCCRQLEAARFFLSESYMLITHLEIKRGKMNELCHHLSNLWLSICPLTSWCLHVFSQYFVCVHTCLICNYKPHEKLVNQLGKAL